MHLQSCLKHIGMIDINATCGELPTLRQLNKVGLILDFILSAPLQHSNLLHICDEAQLGHLLRDSKGNNTPADPAAHNQTAALLTTFSYASSSVCLRPNTC